ncbi:hypothetical protein QC763_608750 [Podospora pseudopauciseta]|uniref:WSC domain-containing protein n=2 Tax=Podospora TaxID=5144 RepID=A0ABR0H618_9PEZI|nr:hypothetical protein QC763_608750 [Podospora pseudopauciseta]KAK4671791.1 hypothetical protein QC764_608750 [Podospora pseudoanserina]
MLNLKTISAGLVAGAAFASAQCTIPTTPLSDDIPSHFRIQVQNASRPEVHNKYMNLFEAGGGDQHLFIGPVGEPTYDFTLVDGVVFNVRKNIRLVIGGEWSEIDHTTKLFSTARPDPDAIFQPTYACNPDTGLLQVELRFVQWEGEPLGGHICVRHSFDGSHEFRYDPPGNTLIDVNRECIKVTLVVLPTLDGGPSTTFSTVTVSSTSSSSSVVPPSSSSTSTLTSTSTSTAPTSTSTSGVLPYTDMTSLGWRYIGCAPEERWTTDGPFRTLSGALLGSDTMTNEACMAFCGANGWAYAGTEWRRECWCGNSYAPTRQPLTTLVSLAKCDYRCSGDSGQFCGGDAWLSLYAKCPTGGPCENAVFT